MERLTWKELDAYGEQTETVTLASGTRLRVRTKTYWDMGPWESDLHIVAEAGPRARRIGRAWPYREHRVRPGEELPR